MAQKRFLSIIELAELLGIPKLTVYQWIHQKRIPCIKFGHRTVRFDREEIERWIEEKKSSPMRG